MAKFRSNAGMSGSLVARKIKNSVDPSVNWTLENLMKNFRGKLNAWFAGQLSKHTGILTVTGTLNAVHTSGETGLVTNYGVLSKKVITTAWANFVAAQLQSESSEFGDLKFHDSGVGTTAAVIADTDIETTDGETRVAGTQTSGASANIYKSVATITYSTSKAITEHGIFTVITGGTMADRHVFAAINVVSTDQIEFTFEMTIDDGG